MTNEEFQKAVLEKLESLDRKTDRIEKKLGDVHDQTALLTEFRTEAYNKLDKIIDDVEFLKQEEFETRQDVFKLKKKIT